MIANSSQKSAFTPVGLLLICLLGLAAPAKDLRAGGCPDLQHIQGDETVPDLLISAIDPGEWIEVFNPGDAAYDFDTSAGDFCEPFVYSLLSGMAPGTVLPPRGYARLPWPPAFTQSDEAGGEIIIYNLAGGHAQDDIADFVCWGSGNGASRKSQAETVGKWIGDCAPAISPGMTIRRLVMTDGITAASYDTNTPPQNCAEGAALDYADGFENLPD